MALKDKDDFQETYFNKLDSKKEGNNVYIMGQNYVHKLNLETMSFEDS